MACCHLIHQCAPAAAERGCVAECWLRAGCVCVQIIPPEFGGTAAWLPVEKAVAKFSIYSNAKPAQNGEGLYSLLLGIILFSTFPLAANMHFLTMHLSFAVVQACSWTRSFQPLRFGEDYFLLLPHAMCLQKSSHHFLKVLLTSRISSSSRQG